VLLLLALGRSPVVVPLGLVDVILSTEKITCGSFFAIVHRELSVFVISTGQKAKSIGIKKGNNGARKKSQQIDIVLH
jgi:hypothetical protein